MFNDKMMCLFAKSYEQLNKEAAKRGISRFAKSTEKSDSRVIAEIIYKDAYDAGRNDAMRECPFKEPPVNDYCLYDNEEDKNYHIQLTDGQARVVRWLEERGCLPDLELTEWTTIIEEIGRI